MFRSTATRALVKSFPTTTRLGYAPASTKFTARLSYSAASAKFRNVQQLSNSRPRVLLPNRPTSALLYATKSEPPIDFKKEREIGEKKITPHPDEVSATSSVRHVMSEEGQGSSTTGNSGTEGATTHGSLRADLETIKETFSLKDVPRESLYIGAAGILPYAATAASTVYLAFDINHAHDHGVGYLFTPETAHQLLDLVTPIQIGYGAVIISFLGAIHWGMEYSGYGGYHSYRRYMYGVVAPAVAWPTIFMPVEYALITQFFAFNFLYFADARAAAKGWFPAWYGIYRFVLTFFVGASIVFSLIGRGRIASHNHNLKGPAQYVKDDRDQQWVALEREEKERRQALAAAEEEEGEEDEGEDSAEVKDGDEEDGDKKSDDEKDEGKEDESKKGEKKDEKKEKKEKK